MLRKTLIAGVATVFLAGCTTGMGTKEGFGTVGGAVAGGLAGSAFGSGTGQLVAVGAGTLLGAFLGSEVGRSLDRADRFHADQAASRAYAAPVGETISWSNPQSGNSGVVTTTREGRANSGAYCREYQQTITVGGRTEQAFGVACQQPDGSWKIVS
ncbi:RT0821/Lpp0805 family surface protein [Arenibaculum sp.]|jgi:surface antigen|uniref:RT0821/Lpp0805 family surface protein n=1 Tax=Arenibaculum sp. TaxID=2865862 RepID=UPI002E11DFFA|nr:RT0821/Lpp0805 family surface protein [Arenibaculum sp.]